MLSEGVNGHLCQVSGDCYSIFSQSGWEMFSPIKQSGHMMARYLVSAFLPQVLSETLHLPITGSLAGDLAPGTVPNGEERKCPLNHRHLLLNPRVKWPESAFDLISLCKRRVTSASLGWWLCFHATLNIIIWPIEPMNIQRENTWLPRAGQNIIISYDTCKIGGSVGALPECGAFFNFHGDNNKCVHWQAKCRKSNRTTVHIDWGNFHWRRCSRLDLHPHKQTLDIHVTSCAQAIWMCRNVS